MNIVYKYAEVNPSEDLTKLSQYAGAYSAATIDKASEFSQLVKQKILTDSYAGGTDHKESAKYCSIGTTIAR